MVSMLYCTTVVTTHNGAASLLRSLLSPTRHPTPSSLSFQVTSVEQLQALWRDYFVVTFVRNPYQRAVSSYKMMMRQLAPGGEADAQYSWGRFCSDPTGFAEECELDPVCSK